MWFKDEGVGWGGGGGGGWGKGERARATGRTGTSSWSLGTKRLPRARYALQVRAVDRAGNVQARLAKRTVRVG